MPVRLFSLFVMIGIANTCMSQRFETNNFRLYTINDGLTGNNIIGITQDASGFIWIATQHGLNRFDGNIFTPFLKTNRYNSIPDDAIFSMGLFGDKLAIATDNGGQVISTKTLEQRNLFVPTSDALHYWSNACRYVGVDRAGNYCVSTKTGFYIFSAKGEIKKRLDYYTEKDIGHAWMMFGSHLHQLPDGNLLQQNSKGLLIHDRTKNSIADVSAYYPSIKKIKPELNNRQLFTFITTYDILLLNVDNNTFDLIDIRNGNTRSYPATFKMQAEIGWQTKPVSIGKNIWALNSRNKGFFLVQIDTIQKTIVTSPVKYFAQHFCNAIFSDRQLRIWIGTDNGLYMENLHPNIIQSFKVESQNRKDSFSITSLYVTTDKIFAGTTQKKILVINKRTKEIIRSIQLSPNPALTNEITNFQLLTPDTLWVSTFSGLHWINVKNFTTGNVDLKKFPDSVRTITFLYRDRSNNIWIPQNTINSICYYNVITRQTEFVDSKNESLLKTNRINSVAEDNKGNIWFGGDAIARWNTQLKKIDTLIEFLPTQRNRKKGFFVMPDSKGDIWVMLNDDGFAKITNKAVHLRPENILPDYRGKDPTLVYDKIFIPTNNGLGYLDLKNSKGIFFHHAEGLPVKAITTFRFIPDATDGSIWFGCEDILCNIPASATNYYRQPPVLTVSELAVMNDTLINYPRNTIQLNHDQNNIRISFSAINFIDPGNMRFAYRINHTKDSGWIEAGTQPNVLLTNISPGTYRLQIKLYAYDNKWPEQIKEIVFIIQPPFWKTTWFLAAMALLIIAAFYLLHRYRVSLVQQRANLDNLLAQSEMKALHSQMNPHFVFNCLNSIKEMILNNENRQASHYMSKFAQLIRTTLENSTKDFISLKATIDYLKRYLEMEKIRNSRFIYSIEVDEKLEPEEIFLPPMLIQPFIENALWHGTDPGKQMLVTVRFFEKEKQLICVVEDDGIGIETSLKNKEKDTNRSSFGIQNIRQRIQLLNEKYDFNSAVVIEDRSTLFPHNQSGTRVILHLPAKNFYT